MSEAELAERVAVVENDLRHVRQAVNVVGNRIDRMNSHKIDPMKKQVEDIHKWVSRSKGFLAGVVMTTTVFWALVLTVGAALWKWITGPSI